MKMKITPRQVEAAYDVASRVYHGKGHIETGAKSLQDTHGLNINSARDFINDYRHLLKGEEFKRALSSQAMDYFLTRIATDQGLASLANAIDALHLHIIYREKNNKVSQRAMRKIISSHEAHLKAPLLLSEHELAFNSAVQKSRNDPLAERQARLKDAVAIPIKVQVITFVFRRNPDVVATVLDRADGLCERCKKPAPFRRKRGDTAYLEVHHKKQLANGGEDTVTNAIALCPNCHRELHFG